MLSGRSCATFEVSSFAEIETREKEPSLQNTGGGREHRNGDGWEEEKESTRELDSLGAAGSLQWTGAKKGKEGEGERALPEA